MWWIFAKWGGNQGTASMKNKVLKYGLMGVGALFALVALAVVWLQLTYEHDYSSTPLPPITASADPDTIARGEYVVHALAHCSACHAPAEMVEQKQLPADKLDLSGGGHFPAGPFGDFYATNLTADEATGLAKASDGQIARAIRHGVDREGRLAAFMKFTVGNMADEDLTAVVSYLRTLPAKERAVPKDEWGILAKALSSKMTPRHEPPIEYVAPGGISVERGRYLANGPAACYTCHTPRDVIAGFVEAGPRFSGSSEAEPDPTDPDFEFITPNLTPGAGGVVGAWSEDQFVERFRRGVAFKGSIMPWDNFKQMTEQDIRSIYQYLKTVPAAAGPSMPGRVPKG